MKNLLTPWKNNSRLNYYLNQTSILIFSTSFLHSIFLPKITSQVLKSHTQMFTFNLLPFFFTFYGTELKIYIPSGQQSEGQQEIIKILGYEFPFTFDNYITDLEKILFLFNTKHHLNFYIGEYFKIFVIFTIIFVLSLLLFTIAYFLSLNTMRDAEKLSQYECGFEPFDEATRHPFDVHFYVVGILFLIFDVEIALLFPWVFSLTFNKWLNFYTMLFFLFILTVGFFYEWHRGALVWPHKQ